MHTQYPITDHETICAPATNAGGALSVIRISGKESVDIADRIFRPLGKKPLKDRLPGSVCYGKIMDSQGQELDEAVVSIYRSPHSYTGEDAVEISCHGSAYIQQQLLNLLIEQGCRMALPGEFTQRAFLNGRMDLSQAEAVADLISARSRAQHQAALSQLRGHFSTELASLRDRLLHLTALLELELDFSDHEDLEFADRKELLELAQVVDKHIAKLIRSFQTGQALKHGIPVAIIGATNVGKSTLLNRLLHEDRAIVSDIHGTTRDTIEDTIDIHGITFRFIDTAGLRQTHDKIEQIGIERTYQAIQKAAIIVWLTSYLPTPEEQAEMQKQAAGKPLICVRNKADLLTSGSEDAKPSPGLPDLDTPLMVSAKYGTGIEELEQRIYQAANIPELSPDDVIVTNARHYDALVSARSHLQRVLSALSQTSDTSAGPSGVYTQASPSSPDLIAEDLRLVLNDLAEITGGKITPQETLQHIFSHFCVGK